MMDRYNITVEQDTHHTMVQTQTYLAQQRKHGQYTDNQQNAVAEGTVEDTRKY